MAQIAVGAAIGAGFRLIRRRPLAVLAWGALPAVMQALVIALLAPMYLNLFGAAIRAAQAGAPTPPDLSSVMPQMMMTQGMVQLLNIGQLLISAVIYCAVFRSVLYPEKSSFAYMRLGKPELFVAALIFAAGIAVVIGVLITVLPIAIIIGVVAATSHGGGAIALLLPIVMLAIVVALVYLALRFAFAGPMMVDDGKFHLGESWELTKGRVGSLFLILLGLFGIALALGIVFDAIVLGLAIGGLNAVAGGFQNIPAFVQQPPQAILSKLAPFLGVYIVIFIPVAGSLIAIVGAPWAKAYRDLKPDVTEAFA